MRIAIFCLALGATTLATADVGLKVTDLDSCILEVTYTFDAKSASWGEVPDGHRLVYTNYPVTLYERDGHTYAEVASTQRKNVIFKTRAK